MATPGVQQFSLTDGADPTDAIAVGPDGNLWFPVSTGSFSESIARMTPTGAVTYYPLSAPAETDPDVSSITPGPDGNMWFTEEGLDTIGEIGTSASGTAAGISLTPSGGLAFGNSTLGVTSRPQTVTVTNTGDAPLMLGTVQIQAAASMPFATTADGCLGETIAPGDACTVGVTFTPAAAGSYAASLEVSGNADNGPQSLALSGSSEPVATGSGASFASVALGTSSAPSAVTIDNTGGAPLQVSNVQITGAQAPSFHLTNDGCSRQNVPAGGSCRVAVTFSPLVAGELSASLSVTDNAAGSPQASALSGAGVTPTVDLTPSGLDFGRYGRANERPTDADRDQYRSRSARDHRAAGRRVRRGRVPDERRDLHRPERPRGGSCTIAVRFSPTGAGDFSASLQIADDGAGAPQSTPLSGVGVGTGAVIAPGDTGIAGVVTNGTGGWQPAGLGHGRGGLLGARWLSPEHPGDHRREWQLPGRAPGGRPLACPGLPARHARRRVSRSHHWGRRRRRPELQARRPRPAQRRCHIPPGWPVRSPPASPRSTSDFRSPSPCRSKSAATRPPERTRVYAFLGSIDSAGGSGISLAGMIMFSLHFWGDWPAREDVRHRRRPARLRPAASASRCANLIGLGSDAQPAVGAQAARRAQATRPAPREADPIAGAAQDCAPGTGAYTGQFNLLPTKNGGVLLEIYYGFRLLR